MPNDRVMMDAHLEVVCWASIVGLAFPIVFAIANSTEIPCLSRLAWLLGALVGASLIVFFLYHSVLKPILSKHFFIVALYIWGGALLVISAIFVHYTGGIKSSIFVWLFGYAIVVMIIVRRRDEERVFKVWRPVWIGGSLEAILVIVLGFFEYYFVLPPVLTADSMTMWGGISAIYVLCITVFIFFLSDEFYKEFYKKVESTHQ